MVRFRFLQLSDLHFGAPMSSSRLELPPEKQAQRQREFEDLVRSLPQIIAQHQLDALLIPGDLWDHENMTGERLRQFRLLYQALCEIKPVPVVIAPGNHDFYSPTSLYHPETLRREGFEPWPEHILIFSRSEFATFPLLGWEGKVQVTGQAFHDNTLNQPDNAHQQVRLLKQIPPRQPTEIIDLLLFHGSRDDRLPNMEKLTAPFSQDEVVALNFDYVAVGHYHRHDKFTNPQGDIKGAYTGSPFARGLDEKGPKFALIVTLDKQGPGPAQVTMEELPLDARQIVGREAPISGAESLEEIEEQLVADLNFHARSQDIIYCELTGEIPPGLPAQWPQILESRLMESHGFFHVKVNADSVSTAYDIQRLREDMHTLEGRFIREIEQHLQSAGSDEEREVLEKALYLGLDAMIRKEVRTP